MLRLRGHQLTLVTALRDRAIMLKSAVGSLSARQLLLRALDSLEFHAESAKAFKMQFNKALALSLSMLSISSAGSPTSSSTSASPSSSNQGSSGQMGVYGVYDSSTTPSYLPWNTYNYCNAPHVNAAHYTTPNESAKMVYMNVMIRHHKVRPTLVHHPCYRYLTFPPIAHTR